MLVQKKTPTIVRVIFAFIFKKITLACSRYQVLQDCLVLLY